ncbi:hypothetical protein AB6A40_005138 [Gnathostoma spinigerum]|uniref:Nicastrin n=1 Tax=Gnathostoma spinigerum TaxID=75299 RepID=A0ABD6EJV3_9BILA
MLRVLCLLSVFLVNVATSERLRDQIYLPLSSTDALHCFRLLNASGQYGCQSNPGGNIGALVYVRSADSFDAAVSFFPKEPSIIIAIDVSLLSRRIVGKLTTLDRIQGVLLLDGPSVQYGNNTPLSEDSSCPNQEFDLYHDDMVFPWNRQGSMLEEGSRFIDWKKPVFILKNSTEIEIIKVHCYDAFNHDHSLHSEYPLCSARMMLFMKAAGDSTICLRRQKIFTGLAELSISMCDPLEDQNVFDIIPAPIERGREANPKLFVVATRMDSFSMMDRAVGDVSVLTSLIASIAVAQSIGMHLKDLEKIANKSHQYLMFSYFHGESMGYIGSSRAAYDMGINSFPVLPDKSLPKLQTFSVNNIDFFIEIQQLTAENPETLFAHVDGVSYNESHHELIDTLVEAANSRLRFVGNRTVEIVDSTRQAMIPPSSFQTFLRENRSIAGFVLAPFAKEYFFKRLNSFADERVSLEKSQRAKEEIFYYATAVLGCIVRYFFGDGEENSPPDYQIDTGFVSEVYDCLVMAPDWNSCQLFKELMKYQVKKPENYLKQTYIVGGASFPSVIRVLVEALMVRTLGSKKDIVNVTNRKQCRDMNKSQQVYRYTWQFDPDTNKTVCYRNSLFTPQALSPAFLNEDYDMKSGRYSTWVESVWEQAALELFLTPHPHHDYVVLGCGMSFFVLCAVIMSCIYEGRKEAIEPPPPTSEADVNAAPL